MSVKTIAFIIYLFYVLIISPAVYTNHKLLAGLFDIAASTSYLILCFNDLDEDDDDDSDSGLMEKIV